MSLKKRIQRQMEFYLGDSNYSKDKFLKQHTNTDGYLDLSIFLTFKRIQSMTRDISIIQEAIKKSKFLELSSDELFVKRKNPLPTNIDSDKRTIYVEGYPENFEHDELRKYFSEFGKVEYVSMPRFKKSKQFKKFSFIEFAKEEYAIEAFTKHKELGENIRVMLKEQWNKLRILLKASENSVEKAESSNSSLKKALTDNYTEGLILKISNITTFISRKDIKDMITKIAPVAFVDDQYGLQEKVYYLRFTSTCHVQNVLQQFQDSFFQKEYQDAVLELVSGEEETKYWKYLIDLKHKSHKRTEKNRLQNANNNNDSIRMDSKNTSYNKNLQSTEKQHLRFDNNPLETAECKRKFEEKEEIVEDNHSTAKKQRQDDANAIKNEENPSSLMSD